jgi:tRNA-dihydrouridine synthase
VKNNPRITIPIFGNGDIDSPQKALEYKNRYGVDGIMIGRAAIGYPWIFREIRHYLETGQAPAAPTVEEKVAVCRQHLAGALAWNGPVQGINEMRGRYGHYLKGIPDIGVYLRQLVRLTDPEEITALLATIEDRYKGHIITTESIRLVNYHTHCAL